MWLCQWGITRTFTVQRRTRTASGWLPVSGWRCMRRLVSSAGLGSISSHWEENHVPPRSQELAQRQEIEERLQSMREKMEAIRQVRLHAQVLMSDAMWVPVLELLMARKSCAPHVARCNISGVCSQQCDLTHFCMDWCRGCLHRDMLWLKTTSIIWKQYGSQRLKFDREFWEKNWRTIKDQWYKSILFSTSLQLTSHHAASGPRSWPFSARRSGEPLLTPGGWGCS